MLSSGLLELDTTYKFGKIFTKTSDFIYTGQLNSENQPHGIGRKITSTLIQEGQFSKGLPIGFQRTINTKTGEYHIGWFDILSKNPPLTPMDFAEENKTDRSQLISSRLKSSRLS